MHSSRLPTACFSCLLRDFSRGGGSAWGVSAQGGIHPIPNCMLGYTHPIVNRMTGMCKNITLPQIRLRAIKTQYSVIASCSRSVAVNHPLFNKDSRQSSALTAWFGRQCFIISTCPFLWASPIPSPIGLFPTPLRRRLHPRFPIPYPIGLPHSVNTDSRILTSLCNYWYFEVGAAPISFPSIEFFTHLQFPPILIYILYNNLGQVCEFV